MSIDIVLVFYQLFRKHLEDHEEAAFFYLKIFFQSSSVDSVKVSVPNIVSF